MPPSALASSTRPRSPRRPDEEHDGGAAYRSTCLGTPDSFAGESDCWLAERLAERLEDGVGCGRVLLCGFAPAQLLPEAEWLKPHPSLSKVGVSCLTLCFCINQSRFYSKD